MDSRSHLKQCGVEADAELLAVVGPRSEMAPLGRGPSHSLDVDGHKAELLAVVGPTSEMDSFGS